MKFPRICLFWVLSFSLTYALQAKSPQGLTVKDGPDQQKLRQFKNKYQGKNIQTFRKGKEVKLSYYDLLLEIERGELGNAALRLHNDVLAIFSDPLNESRGLQYLDHFPDRFSDFVDIFDPPDFGELYHTSELFLLLLEDMIKEHPQQGAVLLVGLSREAKYSADAPALLQRICSIYLHDYYDDFIFEFTKLNRQDGLRAIEFLADYENFDGNVVFDGILKKLEEKNNSGLLKKFLAAREKRRARRDYGRGPRLFVLFCQP